MDQSILRQSLKTIEFIYNDSMYNDTDIYRVKDLIHSLDDNHWKSKEWLADAIASVYGKWDGGKFVVLGGWYGLGAYCLRKMFPEDTFHIVSVDMDPICAKVGWELFKDYNIEFITADAFEYDTKDADVIVNTSCEHMSQEMVNSLIKKKGKWTWCAFQSCDLVHPSHVNTQADEISFRDSMQGLTDVRYIGQLPNSGFKRYMVIGR